MLREFPVVCLLGPRQSGKTTAATEYAKRSKKPVLYLDMESPADTRRLGDAEYTLKQYADHLVIIDEIQFRPDLFPLQPLGERLRVPQPTMLVRKHMP